MALPPGFDPNTGTLGRVGNTVRRIMPNPVQSAEIGRSAYHRTFWGRINDAISSICIWIQSRADTIAFVLAAIPALAGLVSLIVWVVRTFSNEGAFFGILSIIGAFMAIGLGYYAICIIYGVVYFAIFLFGYIFYNIYTLLITIAIGVLIGSGAIDSGLSMLAKKRTDTETVAPAYTIYRCTATRLNVREQPSQNSSIIGTISRGTSIKVYGIEGDFARIKWNDRTAYVSIDYISRE